MSKYGSVIEKTKRKSNGKTGKSASLKAIETDLEVNLSIKVPLSLRRHWAAEAKRRGTTLTAAISEALAARFGEPS